MRSISYTEYLMGRARVEDLPLGCVQNMVVLLTIVNNLLIEFGEYRKVVSGYRRPEDNAAAGGAKKSAHMTCEAIDLEDKDERFKKFMTEELLEKFGLYREADKATPSWIHLTTRAPRSGSRVFNP